MLDGRVRKAAVTSGNFEPRRSAMIVVSSLAERDKDGHCIIQCDGYR